MMEKKTIKNLLMNEENITKSAYIWNSVAAMLNSFQMMLLLVFLTRFGSEKEQSYFVMAYAVANLLYYVSKYGIRQFQVTDVKEKYSFKDYYNVRIITTAMYMLAMMLYLIYSYTFSNYTIEKITIVILVCLIRMVEGFEDVLHGRMQQKGRLDVAARILGIRFIVYILGFIALFVFTRNLAVTLFISFVLTLVLSIVLNKAVIGEFVSKSEISTKMEKKLLIESLPLCLASLLNIYIANAPKYTIDTVISDEMQTKFNIVFMPVFVITLLSGFVYQPLAKMIGELWHDSQIKKMRLYLYKNIAIILAIGSFVLICGFFLGIPVLELIYGIQLDEFKTILVILLAIGILIAISNLMMLYITTVREQKSMMVIYFVLAFLFLVFSKNILVNYGLMALCKLYGCIMMLMVIFFGIIIEVKLHKYEVRKEI